MGPLAGIRVLELEGMGPGPFCGMMLADMGAEVLVIARRPENVTRSRFDILSRNKKVIALELKNDTGRAVFLDLITAAAMVIDPFRPGVTERLGIGPDHCRARNPALVYGRMTGWGQTGPLADAAGRDLNYIALTGALHCIGTAERPIIPLNLLGDYGGGVYLLAGLLAAHVHAVKTGEGQMVEASIAESVTSLMTATYGYLAEGRWSHARAANFLDGGAPYYNVYQCRDGKFVTVAAIERKAFGELLTRLGLQSGDPPDPQDRSRWDELTEKLAAVFATRTQREWCEMLEGTEVCFAPVLSMEEAPRHPQMTARGAFTTSDDVLQPAPTPRFEKTPSEIRHGPTAAAADRDQILRAWGVDPERIAALERNG